jgi:hypothetical protein
MSSTRYSCKILIKLEFSEQIFLKYSNNKYHENPSSGSQAVPCGWREGQRETDMSRLTVLVCKFVNAPKKCFVYKSERKANGKKSRRYGRQRQIEKLGC